MKRSVVRGTWTCRHSPFSSDYTEANFTTADLRAYHQPLQQKGVQVTEIKDRGAVVGFDFYDPDGNKLGVVVDKENFSE